MNEKVNTAEIHKNTEFSNIKLESKDFPKKEPKLNPALFVESPSKERSEESKGRYKRLTVKRRKRHLNPIPLLALKDIALAVTTSGLFITSGLLPTAAVQTTIILYFTVAFTIAALLMGTDLLIRYLTEK